MYQDDYKEYVELIRSRLSPKRFVHSMNVAAEGVRLARLYGGDEKKAYLAGILHDIMKEEKPEIQLQTMKEYDILTDTVTLQAKPLWHAKAGAFYCEHTLGLCDRDLLNAIAYHTTGRAGMSQLEKILYLADYIGEDRDYPDVDVMRRETLASMERGMVYALTYSITDLAQRGRAIHQDTLNAYNEVVLLRKESGEHR